MFFKLSLRLIIFFSSLTLMNFYLLSGVVYAQEKSSSTQEYISEDKRARLAEVRKCFKENPGTSWSECRYNCAETCNEILETYTRGVCNGALIQLCCGQHPGGCK